MAKTEQFPFTRSREYRESVKSLQASLLTNLDPTLKAFWSAYDQDSQGVPAARLEAVKLSRVLRESYGMGAKKAATVMGREDGDNGAQRYFDVARGWSEGLITESDILSTGITSLASYIRDRRKADAGLKPQPEAQKVAFKAFERIVASIIKADRTFNCSALLVRKLTGTTDDSFMAKPEDRTAIHESDVILHPTAPAEGEETSEVTVEETAENLVPASN